MRARNRDLAAQIEAGLRRFHAEARPLPGISDAKIREVLVEQIVESVRRVQFVACIRERPVSPSRTDPSNPQMFDPVRAAVWHANSGNADEAAWLVFLFVHFGKHRAGGWRYVRETYGALGEQDPWDWNRASFDEGRAFSNWIEQNIDTLRRPGAGFGPHRMRESFLAAGAVVRSYVAWVSPPRSVSDLINVAVATAGSAEAGFAELFRSMAMVQRFGRLAKFDFLCMLKKLGLAEIEPEIPFLKGSSGPLKGARLLFGSQQSPDTLDEWVAELGAELGLCMQVMEDSLCNWQKSPNRFKPFRS